jgi:hypothetical protein
MQTYQLTTSQWLALKPEVKNRLKEIFSIPRSSGTRVFQGPNGSVVESDGYTMSDLAAITLENMSAYLGCELMTDFYGTFDSVLVKVERELNGAEVEKAVVAPPTEISAAIAAEEKKPKKK